MSNSRRIVVVGGSAAGPKAAAKARRMDQDASITLVQKAPDLSMASCGYPYYVGGTFDDRNELLCTPAGVVRDPKFFLKAKGITAWTETEATEIDRAAHTVTCRDLKTGETRVIPYDKLVLATGAEAIRPPVPGLDLAGVTAMQTMADTDYLRRVVAERKTKRAVIVGGGLIGVETCEALQLAGIQIAMVEMLPQLLAFLDWEMAKLVENHVRAKGVQVITSDAVEEFLGENGAVRAVRLRSGAELPCDLAVVAVGVRPHAKLAAACGLAVGARGGITVNAFMQTSDPDIYAAGDCVEVPHLLTGKPVHMPLGDLANLQGRVAGQNVVLGNVARFPGTIQTGICKVFDFAAGSTGLSERGAHAAGFDVETALTAGADKPKYMGGKLLVMKLVAERGTGRLLGCQCVGPGEASKRIGEAAMAIHGGLKVSDLVNADLPYAPPFSPALDTLPTTAHVLENKMLGRMKGITAADVKKKLDAGEKVFLIDTRGPDEYAEMRLGVGETLIPLGALRDRLADLPADKDAEIVCYCKISLRGYEAAGLIEARGWRNVKVMEGGLAAWPFAREK